MPTIKRIPGPYRLFFYSFDCNEPEHVHAERERERAVCKFWLAPVALASNSSFSARELNRVRDVVIGNRSRILEAWHEHCG